MAGTFLIFTNVHGQEPSPALPPAVVEPPRTVTFKDSRTGLERTVTVPRHPSIIERVGREGIDMDQCQAPTNSEGIGNARIQTRCINKPATNVIVENDPRPDGSIGGMALCDLCCKRVLATHGADYAKVTPLVAMVLPPISGKK